MVWCYLPSPLGVSVLLVQVKMEIGRGNVTGKEMKNELKEKKSKQAGFHLYLEKEL